MPRRGFASIRDREMNSTPTSRNMCLNRLRILENGCRTPDDYITLFQHLHESTNENRAVLRHIISVVMDIEQARYVQMIPNPAIMPSNLGYPADGILRIETLERADFERFYITSDELQNAIEFGIVQNSVVNRWGTLGNALETLRYLNRMHDYNRPVPDFRPNDPLPNLNEVADVFRLPYMEGNVGEYLDPDITGIPFYDVVPAPAVQPIFGGALGGNIGAAQPPVAPPPAAHVIIGHQGVNIQQ